MAKTLTLEEQRKIKVQEKKTNELLKSNEEKPLDARELMFFVWDMALSK